MTVLTQCSASRLFSFPASVVAILSLCVVLQLRPAAAAQEDALQDAGAPEEEPATESAANGDALARLGAAIEAAKKHADQRFAFTLDYWARDKDNEPVAAMARFDPRRADGDKWRLVGASAENPDKAMEKALKNINKAEQSAADDVLVYDGLSDLLPFAELQRETDEAAFFTARNFDEDLPEGSLEATIVLDTANGYISRVEMRALKSFKPAPVVRVRAMEQVYEFTAPENNGPALIAASSSKAEGKAFFRRFDRETRMKYTDITPVDVPPLPIGVSGGESVEAAGSDSD